MVSSSLPLVQSYHPPTFMERGVVVPFTTPLLTGARVRPGERGVTELLVPNPSGGRGVYILPWANLRALCQPTVHDRLLYKKAVKLTGITPSSIREIARQVAAEGLAGSAARQAALAAMAAEQHDRLMTNFRLLMRLIKQIVPGAAERLDAQPASMADIEQRARQAVRLIADHIRHPPDVVASNLEALAGQFASIGMPGQAEVCRIPHLLRTLRRVHDEVAAWSGQFSDADGDGRSGAEMILAAADLTLSCAEATLAEALALTVDTVVLLRDWNATPEKIARLVARPDWLLDGWEQICALWDDATHSADRLAVLPEMAQIVPVLPQETASWVGVRVDPAKLAAFRRRVLLNEDWRTGTAVHSLTARNERLRALAP